MSSQERGQQPHEKVSILIIDDDEHILNLLTKLLSKLGYVTDTAKTGAEAVEKSKTKSFSIALIDIVLPDMQGTQLLVKLKDAVPRMRKIIITGHATLANAVEALNLGADAYIMKPFKLEDLAKVIEEQLKAQREETTITARKIAEFVKARKTIFFEVINQSLEAFLGKSVTQSIIYHLGGKEALEDADVLTKRLRALFKEEGAEIILNHILKSLESYRDEDAEEGSRRQESELQ